MNKQVPHVFVLPEDDANRQLANGFVLDGGLDGRRIQILEEAGGWMEVLNRFTMLNLLRWVSPRTIKETFVSPVDYKYPFLSE